MSRRIAVAIILALVFLPAAALAVRWWRNQARANLGLVPADPTAPVAAQITPPIPAGAGDWFADVTAEAGLDFVHVLADGAMDNLVEALGSGACVLDYDADGRQDLYLVNQVWQEGISSGQLSGGARPEGPAPTGKLYRNLGHGRFQDVTAATRLDRPCFGLGAAAADYDNDGDVDLYVCCAGSNLLWQNQGDGTFQERAASAGVAEVAGDSGLSTGAAFVDLDNDGLLDLYVADYAIYDPNYKLYYQPQGFPGPLAYDPDPDHYYRNLGQGRFEDATTSAGFDVMPGRAMGVTAGDLDADGDVDLFVANDATANFLFVNDGHGRFTEEARQRGTAFGVNGDAAGSMTGAIADYDGNGLLDLMVTDTSYGSLYMGVQGGKLFEDRVVASGLAALCAQYVSWGAAVIDYDRDTDPDVLVVNGDLFFRTGREALLLENSGNGAFTDASGHGGAYFRQKLPARAAVPMDMDDDGDLDVLVTLVGDRPVLLSNQIPSTNHWIGLSLAGTRTNVLGFGARVSVTAGGRTWTRLHLPASGYLCQGDPRLIFSLGELASVDRVEVTWPTGAHSVLERPAADQYHRVVEGETP